MAEVSYTARNPLGRSRTLRAPLTSQTSRYWMDMDLQARRLGGGSEVISRRANKRIDQVGPNIARHAIKVALDIFRNNGGQQFFDDKKKYYNTYNATGFSGFTQSELLQKLDFFERWNKLVTNEHELRINTEPGNPMLFVLEQLSFLIEKAKDFYGQAIKDDIPEEQGFKREVSAYTKRAVASKLRNVRLAITEPLRQKALSDSLFGVVLRSGLGKLQAKKDRGIISNTILKAFNMGTDIGGINYRNASKVPNVPTYQPTQFQSPAPSSTGINIRGMQQLPTTVPARAVSEPVNSLPQGIARKSLSSRLGFSLGNVFKSAQGSVKGALDAFNSARLAGRDEVTEVSSNNAALDVDRFQSIEARSISSIASIDEKYNELVIANIEEIGDALVRGFYRGKPIILNRGGASSVSANLGNLGGNRRTARSANTTGGLKNPARRPTRSPLRRSMMNSKIVTEVESKLPAMGSKLETKMVGKTAGKVLGKKIPGVGAILGAGLALKRLASGDILGAFGEVASGLASTVPVIGTAASLAIDAALIAKDLNDDSTDAVEDIQEESKSWFSSIWDSLFGDGGKPQVTKRSLAPGGGGGAPGTGTSIYYDRFNPSGGGSNSNRMTAAEAANAEAAITPFNPNIRLNAPTNSRAKGATGRKYGALNDENILPAILAKGQGRDITGLLSAREESGGALNAVTYDTNNALSLGRFQVNSGGGTDSLWELTQDLKNNPDPEAQQIGREIEAARISESGSATGVLRNKQGATAQVFNKYKNSKVFGEVQASSARDRFLGEKQYAKYDKEAPGLSKYLENDPIAREIAFETNVQFGGNTGHVVAAWNQAKGNPEAFQQILYQRKTNAFYNSKNENNRRLAPQAEARFKASLELWKASKGLSSTSSASGMVTPSMLVPGTGTVQEIPTSDSDLTQKSVDAALANTRAQTMQPQQQKDVQQQSPVQQQVPRETPSIIPPKQATARPNPFSFRPSPGMSTSAKMYIDDPSTQAFKIDPLKPI